MAEIEEEFALTDAEKQEELRLQKAASEVFLEGNPGTIQPFKVPEGKQPKKGVPTPLDDCLNKLDKKEAEMKKMRNIIADYRNEEYFKKQKLEADLKKKEKNKWFSFGKPKTATKSSKKDVDLTVLPPLSGLGLLATRGVVIEPSPKKEVADKIVEGVENMKEGGILLMMQKDESPPKSLDEYTSFDDSDITKIPFRYSAKGVNTDDDQTPPRRNFWDFLKRKRGGKRTRKRKRRKKKSRRRRKKKTRKKRTKKMKLSTSDYRKILKFYKLSIPKKVSTLRKKGDKIIAKKFCSCIKKVRAKFKKEGIAIAICTKSVITRKGIKRGKFKCKKRRSIKLFKGGSKRCTKKK